MFRRRVVVGGVSVVVCSQGPVAWCALVNMHLTAANSWVGFGAPVFAARYASTYILFLFI